MNRVKGKHSIYFFEKSSLGIEFETDMVEVISSFAKKTWGTSSVKFTTTKQDRYEGTDLFVLGIPVDITTAYKTKKRMKHLKKIVRNGMVFELGLRYGNEYCTFKTPVLVIGVKTEYCEITKANSWCVLGDIKANIEEVLNIGMDKYLWATA